MSSVSHQLMAHHPIQRLSSPSRGVSALVHSLGIVSFSLSFKLLVDYPAVISGSYGWYWQCLTILELTVAMATFVFGLLADLAVSPQLFFIKNSLSLCGAPLEVLISILYWGISAIDRQLLIPSDFPIASTADILLAPTADIGFHAMPALLLTIDLLFLSPPWAIHALPAMGLSSAAAFWYWFWVEHCFKHTGFYPYPLLDQLETLQRIVLFSFAALTMTGSIVMLQWLYGRVNGLQGTEKRSTPRNTKGE